MTPKQESEEQTSLSQLRTHMASERTFLSYIRTSLALLIAGLTVLRFFGDGGFYRIAGIALCASAAVIVAIGFWRYRRHKKMVRQIDEDV